MVKIEFFSITIQMPMARLYFPILFLFPFFFYSCDEEDPNRKAALDSLKGKPVQKFIEVLPFLGVYQDTLPCADCIGILTRLELKSDSSYKKSVTFLGKGDPMANTFSTKGRWKWDARKGKLWLDSIQEKQHVSFRIEGDTALRACDLKGIPIKSSHSALNRL